MKDYLSFTPSELFVRIQGQYEVEANVVLIIPSVKAFVEGGKLKGEKQYGFDELDGTIPLPQLAQCYIMAFAEYKDKIVFGKTSFASQQKQTIDVTLTETTKELMKMQIKEMRLDNADLEIEKIDNPIRNADYNNKLKEADKLKPANCNCGTNK